MTKLAPPSGGVLIVLTTVANQADAQALARVLVEKRLAACAQINAIESVYRWEGAIQQGTEWRILLKTASDRYQALEAAILQHHPYDLPAIVALPSSHALASFAQWVGEESGAQASPPQAQG
ncbi:divalent-cation tolerance protein CutA [Ottowia caeni]|uniref:divalent-cation tolerance protein CutA n=1 Tax=Ottowia caeni TaxID=2870339 RepID=UPI003D72D64A|nr:divalent-cation tolerance protein CutA [Ottowia caeni]